MKKLFPYLVYLKDVKMAFILAILAGIFYGASTGLGIPVLIRYLYPKIFSNEAISVMTLTLICTLPVIVSAFRAGGNFLNSYYLSYCGQYILQQLRIKVFAKIQNLPIAFFHKRQPGDLISRVSNDTTILQQTIINASQEILKQPITLLGAVSYIVYMCFQQSDVVFLIIFILAIPLCIVPIRYIGIKMRNKARAMQEQTSELTHRLAQNLSAVKEIRSFCLEEYELSRYEAVCHVLRERFLKVVKYTSILSPSIEVIASFGVAMAFWYSYKSKIEPDVFISIVGALYLSYEPIKKLGRLNSEMQQGLASLERLENILEEPITIHDPAVPHPVGKLEGNIQFKNVSFAYEMAPVLRDVTVHLTAKKTYALVGPSGAGKTTFAHLIPRFYDLAEGNGSITIDGINIKDMRLKDLRQNIALVSQDPVLFNDTIYNNILVGKPSASHEELMTAAKRAFAHHFILELENGYDTLVGENGSMLSGGQKQRIALARAFLKDAPILILDEATSALDANSEQLIQQALEELFKGKTVIIIAHRFSTIKHADRIFVFKSGEIIEEGTHDLLCEGKGLYEELYAKQS
ncbi:MAG: hypothetical protein AUJ82_07115 [Verrucomicrobia bacterium CG1_02_43_26]|nr:MAG: hypothetical protein AUJ82_07115 [Verrucomicrobia bacterium CG1_02_43_26]